MKKLVVIGVLFIMALSCKKRDSASEIEAINTFASIKIERYDVKDGNLDSMALSTYIVKSFDSTGLETKSVYYSADDAIMMQFVNQYTNGNKTLVDWVNAKNEKVRYVKMSYNDSNQITKSETFSPEGEFKSGFIHQWKDNGHVEEKGPIDEDKPFKPNSIYSYNAQKEFIKLVEYDENDSLYGTFTWKYLDFDENNEWVERQMLFNDTLVRIEKRLITYHE